MPHLSRSMKSRRGTGTPVAAAAAVAHTAGAPVAPIEGSSNPPLLSSSGKSPQPAHTRSVRVSVAFLPRVRVALLLKRTELLRLGTERSTLRTGVSRGLKARAPRFQVTSWTWLCCAGAVFEPAEICMSFALLSQGKAGTREDSCKALRAPVSEGKGGAVKTVYATVGFCFVYLQGPRVQGQCSLTVKDPRSSGCPRAHVCLHCHFAVVLRRGMASKKQIYRKYTIKLNFTWLRCACLTGAGCFAQAVFCELAPAADMRSWKHNQWLYSNILLQHILCTRTNELGATAYGDICGDACA